MSNSLGTDLNPIHKPRLGLALSGGGARGLAHIGVLKILAREGIPINCLSGTSMGGVIAAGYAAGMSPTDMEREAIATTRLRKLIRLADPGIPDPGLLRGQRLLEYFESLLGKRTFAELEYPLALVAVDMIARQEVVLSEGTVSLALRATTAIPGLISPMETDGMQLVDGGLLDNLPVDAVRNLGAEVVIAVDLRPDPDEPSGRRIDDYRWLPGSLTRTMVLLYETISLLMEEAQKEKRQQNPPDVLIRPNIPPGVNVLMGYGRAPEIINSGELAAEAALPEILRLLQLR